VLGAGVSLSWTGNFFPAGQLPATLPAIQPSSDPYLSAIVGSTQSSYTPTSVSGCSQHPQQYQLTISAFPAAGGSVAPNSGGIYQSGTVVPIGANANGGYVFAGWSGSAANPSSAFTTVTMNGPQTVTATFAAIGGSPFFATEVAAGDGVDYMVFPDAVPFGYYGFLQGSASTANAWLYHFDLGYEYSTAGTASGGIYFYDLASGHWWYTGSSLFPYLYDFTLNTWIYYFPNTTNPGHYTTDPRYFSNLRTGVVFTM
jgi:uncharacterized repeat protein (TIGR02543 family)